MRSLVVLIVSSIAIVFMASSCVTLSLSPKDGLSIGVNVPLPITQKAGENE